MRILLAVFILLLVVPACKKDKQTQIPYVYVNLQLYPNSMDYIPIGGHIYKNAGYRGIVIYRFLSDQFMVYERCCPYDPEKTGAIITVDPSGTTCTDSVCMSRFMLYDGSRFDGPSPFSLLPYRYTYDGDALYIYN